ncbi:MAG: flagellar biosynthetic protein FliR [Desulfovibrionales bacterium]
MDLFHFDPATILSFLLSLFRVSIIVFLLPFFGSRLTPVPVKACLCLVLTLGIWPMVSIPGSLFPAHPLSVALMLLGEAVLGLILGMVVRFVFAAAQIGGQLIGFQMGFAMINVVDPVTGTSEAPTAHFLYMVALLTFLSLNGHLYMLKGLSASFETVPPGELLITPAIAREVLGFSGQMFILAIKIAAPVTVAIFLVDLALALIARAAPQMNVLFVGFPLKVTVGFLFVGMIFSLLAVHIQTFIQRLDPLFSLLLRSAS